MNHFEKTLLEKIFEHHEIDITPTSIELLKQELDTVDRKTIFGGCESLVTLGLILKINPDGSMEEQRFEITPAGAECLGRKVMDWETFANHNLVKVSFEYNPVFGGHVGQHTRSQTNLYTLILTFSDSSEFIEYFTNDEVRALKALRNGSVGTWKEWFRENKPTLFRQEIKLNDRHEIIPALMKRIRFIR